jgi:hypothetical protein
MHWLDPDYLPELEGTVDRFLLNPRGDADGMILTDGAQVHFPPHMSADVLDGVQLGATIKVRGVRPRGADIIAAIAIETRDGKRIVDHGPPKKEHGEHARAPKHAAKLERKTVQAEGLVQRALHGPKGEVRGALLEDGRIIRFPHDRAGEVAELIAAGARLVVRGDGLTTSIGTVIEAHEMGDSKERLRRFAPRKPKHDEPKRDGSPKRDKASRIA